MSGYVVIFLKTLFALTCTYTYLHVWMHLKSPINFLGDLLATALLKCKKMSALIELGKCAKN